jgi:flagellar hook-basal body complex protein FliE
MRTKKGAGLIPEAAMLEKKEYLSVSLDRKGFIEKTLRETNSTFGKSLHQATEDVQFLQTVTGKMAVGEKVNVHDVIVALDKARNSFDQLVQVRNRMFEAYREILRKRS